MREQYEIGGAILSEPLVLTQEQANQMGTVWLQLLSIALLTGRDGGLAGRGDDDLQERALYLMVMGLSLTQAGEVGSRAWDADQAIWGQMRTLFVEAVAARDAEAEP